MKPKHLLRAGILLAILGPTLHAMIPIGAASRSPRLVPSETGAPILRKAPASVDLEGDGPHPVAIKGERFDAGLTVTLRSHRWIYTFGRNSLTNASTTSFELDLAWVDEGSYVVSVRNGSGLKSNTLEMTIRRTPGPQ